MHYAVDNTHTHMDGTVSKATCRAVPPSSGAGGRRWSCGSYGSCRSCGTYGSYGNCAILWAMEATGATGTVEATGATGAAGGTAQHVAFSITSTTNAEGIKSLLAVYCLVMVSTFCKGIIKPWLQSSWKEKFPHYKPNCFTVCNWQLSKIGKNLIKFILFALTWSRHSKGL